MTGRDITSTLISDTIAAGSSCEVRPVVGKAFGVATTAGVTVEGAVLVLLLFVVGASAVVDDVFFELELDVVAGLSESVSKITDEVDFLTKLV